jgi:Tfp pilus assembly protein PilN
VIRTNLSTRPFYNERLVRLALILLAVVVVAATVFNVTRILRYSRSDTRLATQASRDEARAADLRQQAAQLRASVDPKQIEQASEGARQANDLIDRRTFSWTELLNRFETMLPDDVHLNSVRPRLDRDGVVLRVAVAARGIEDVSAFIDKLDQSGVFPNVRPAEEHVDDDGLLQSMLEMGYKPGQAKPVASDATDAADKPAAAEQQPAEPAEAAQPMPAPSGSQPAANPSGRGNRGRR